MSSKRRRLFLPPVGCPGAHLERIGRQLALVAAERSSSVPDVARWANSGTMGTLCAAKRSTVLAVADHRSGSNIGAEERVISGVANLGLHGEEKSNHTRARELPGKQGNKGLLVGMRVACLKYR